MGRMICTATSANRDGGRDGEAAPRPDAAVRVPQHGNKSTTAGGTPMAAALNEADGPERIRAVNP